VCWKPRSSCWSFHLLREEFLSAPIHSPPPLSGSPYRSFKCRRSCFPLRLVFVQPATRPPLRCFAHSPSKLFRCLRRQPPEEAWKKTERRTPACIADHASVLGDIRVPPLDGCSDVPLHRRRSLSSFIFPCTHPSPAST
jgi:hypothetical protein